MITTQILNHTQFNQIIKRLAYQVYEQHFDEKGIVIAGIDGRGFDLAKILATEIEQISKLKVELTAIVLNKENPTEKQIELSNKQIKSTQKSVLVVDDVLNTGKTLLYGLIPFVNQKARKISTLVLVDRNHKNFPIAANFIGISLSTTLQEHVEVQIVKDKVQVFLK